MMHNAAGSRRGDQVDYEVENDHGVENTSGSIVERSFWFGPPARPFGQGLPRLAVLFILFLALQCEIVDGYLTLSLARGGRELDGLCRSEKRTRDMIG